MPESTYAPAGFCPACGYRIDPGRCPECGRHVTRPWRIEPRVYRWRRRLVVLAVLAGAITAAWWYGPGLAVRHTPSRVLVWVWELDWIGADWAEGVLQGRLSAAYAAVGAAGKPIREEFSAKVGELRDHDWAGTYAQVMIWTLGVRCLSLTEADALWFETGKLRPGPVMRGCVVGFDGVTLRLALPTDRHVLRWGDLDSELVLVRWGDRRYLVASEELIDFCNDINGGEPLHELHLVRGLGDRATPVEWCRRPPADQQPVLPTPFQRFILRDPIHARITDCGVGDLPARRSVVHLEQTAQSLGLNVHAYKVQLEVEHSAESFVGMRLYAPDRYGLAQVKSVRGKTLKATYLGLSPAGAQKPLQPGLVLSTLAPPPVPLASELDKERATMRYWFYGYSELATDNDPASPAHIAELRIGMARQDWLLLELSRELRRLD